MFQKLVGLLLKTVPSIKKINNGYSAQQQTMPIVR